MKLKLEISLDNADARDNEDEHNHNPYAVSGYISDVAESIGYGFTRGQVIDGNGNNIGLWFITEDE